MSIAYVQSTSVGFSGSGSRSLAFLSANTAGNFLVAVMSGAGTVCSDTAGNTWISTGTGIWYCAACVGGSNQVTISGSSGVQAMTVGEFSGVNTHDVGGSGTDSGGAATWTSNSINTVASNELCISQVTNGYGNLGMNSPFTLLGTGENYFIVGYYIATTLQTGLTCNGSNGNGNILNTWGYSLDGFYYLAPIAHLLGLSGCGG